MHHNKYAYFKNGFISILNSDGSEKKLKWITALNAPKGMAIFKGKLYVADIDQLVVIDIDKGTVVEKYDAPDAVFLNDVTACMNGMIFVSDTRTAKIHVLNENKFTVWTEGTPLETPNGLMAEKGKLLVGDKNIYEFDIKTKEVVKKTKNIINGSQYSQILKMSCVNTSRSESPDFDYQLREWRD